MFLCGLSFSLDATMNFGRWLEQKKPYYDKTRVRSKGLVHKVVSVELAKTYMNWCLGPLRGTTCQGNRIR